MSSCLSVRSFNTHLWCESCTHAANLIPCRCMHACSLFDSRGRRYGSTALKSPQRARNPPMQKVRLHDATNTWDAPPHPSPPTALDIKPRTQLHTTILLRSYLISDHPLHYVPEVLNYRLCTDSVRSCHLRGLPRSYRG